MEEYQNLIVLYTKEIAGPTAVTSLQEIETVGMEQCNTFIAECFVRQKRSLCDLIEEKHSVLSTCTHWQHHESRASSGLFQKYRDKYRNSEDLQSTTQWIFLEFYVFLHLHYTKKLNKTQDHNLYSHSYSSMI